MIGAGKKNLLSCGGPTSKILQFSIQQTNPKHPKTNSLIAERFSSRGSALTTAGRKHVARLPKGVP